MKMELTECSETSAYKIQTPGNYPEENIQHTEHGESLKSRIIHLCAVFFFKMAEEKYFYRNISSGEIFLVPKTFFGTLSFERTECEKSRNGFFW